MSGRWVKGADGRLIVTAKIGWINGISSGDQYRRIVFYISHVSKRVEPTKPSFAASTELFDSYFFIEEMTPISKPTDGLPK